MKTGKSVKFSVKVSKPEPQSANCCVIGIYQSKTLRDSAKNLNAQSKGVLAKYLRRGDLSGKSSEILVLRDVPGLPYQQLVVVGYGKQQDLDIPKYRKVNAAVARRLRGMRVNSASLRLHEIEVKDIGLSMRSRHLVESMASALYRFDQLKSAKSESKPDIKFNLCVDSKSDGILARTGVAQANAITTGMTLARNLANLPGNICTPSYLAGQARKLQRTYPIKTRILNKSEMEKLGMGSLLSVSRGSREPPKLICMRYSGGPKNQAPVALVGKGLTFDAGGISLKPAAKMDEMKYDMCGAASVFGTLAAIAEMKLAINVVGVVPSSENLPDGAANKPGDIVTSMSGKTIEILNTDAEGRLILCDALTFTERYKPAAVVDIATLTGACVVALGHQASGLMTNDQELADDLLSAGEQSLDRAWQLPLWDAYQSQLDSNFADIANIGGPAAGSITAGCFLSRFTGSFRWAHLDIAGTAWDSGTKKGATGRVVPLLTQFLINRCHK